MIMKVRSRDEIKKIIDIAHHNGKIVVTTNGCFDILHVGHLRYLQEARKLGDILIVCINSDRSVSSIKTNRPIIHQDDRAELLDGLECVDYVMIFDEPNPIEFLNILRPDIHVKGGDYTPESMIEYDTIKSIGAKLHILPLVDGKSTSNIIQCILDKYK